MIILQKKKKKKEDKKYWWDAEKLETLYTADGGIK